MQGEDSQVWACTTRAKLTGPPWWGCRQERRVHSSRAQSRGKSKTRGAHERVCALTVGALPGSLTAPAATWGGVGGLGGLSGGGGP